MNDFGNLLFDSTLVGIGVPVLGKAHEIAMHIKDKHNTIWKWDGELAGKCLKDNFKGTVTIGIVAAVTFATATWVSKISGNEKTHPQNIQFNHSR